MKKLLSLCLCVLSFMAGVRAQAPVVEVTDDITTFQLWDNDNIYLLKGTIYVSGLLFIEPGTIIKGDKATTGCLVITKTGSINANSPADDDPPTVFTSSEPVGSRAPGDWGGIVVLGEGPVNASGGTATFNPINVGGSGSYGGTDPTDNSGSMQKIRIEFAGATVGGQTLPGLTLAGVNSATTFTDIMVSNCAGDGFRILGGNVSIDYLVSHRNGDDDFDISQGFTGCLQYGIGSRDNAIAGGDALGANGLEIKNDAAGSSNTPFTQPLISNFTFVGPLETPSTTVDADFSNGIWIGNNGRARIYNTAVAAWPTGLNINGSGAQGAADGGTTDIRNTYLAGYLDSLMADGGWSIASYFGAGARDNAIFPLNDSLYLDDPFNLDFPDFRPMEASPLRGQADFSALTGTDSACLNTTVGFVGAFGMDADWTLCWTNFDPSMEPYTEGSDELTAPIVADYTYENLTGDDSLTVQFFQQCSGAVEYFWQFGDPASSTSTDPDPVFAYPGYGTYEVRLKCSGPCDNVDSVSNTASISGLGSFLPGATVMLYPNPASTQTNLDLNLTASETLRLCIMDLTGRRLADFGQHRFPAGANRLPLDVQVLNEGLYLIVLEGRNGMRALKLRVY